MIEGICVPPDQVSTVWPQVSFLVRQSAEVGDTPFDELEADVMSGKGLLWLVVEGKELLAACTTHLETVKGVKLCTVSSCAGGPLDKMLPLIERLETYARDEGCKRMRVNGRRGWQRVLGDYDLTQIVLEKAL